MTAPRRRRRQNAAPAHRYRIGPLTVLHFRQSRNARTPRMTDSGKSLFSKLVKRGFLIAVA